MNNHFILILALFYSVGCSSLQISKRNPANESSGLVTHSIPLAERIEDPELDFDLPLDTHTHIFFGDDKLLKDRLHEFSGSTIVGKSFLISPSYLIDSRMDPDDLVLDIEKIDKEAFFKRNIWNKRTSEIAASSDKYFGLCGMNYTWIDFSEILNECMLNDSMIGFKLRFPGADFYEDDRLSNNDYLKRIMKGIHDSQERVKVVLIHPASIDYQILRDNPNLLNTNKSPSGELEDDIRELSALIKLAKMFPDINFLVAHAFNSHRVINALSSLIKNNQVTNIYLETSSLFRLGQLDGEAKLLVKSLRNFGLDRVIFGSDLLLLDGEEDVIINGELKTLNLREAFNKELSYLLSTGFTKSEIKKILQDNGDLFLENLSEK